MRWEDGVEMKVSLLRLVMKQQQQQYTQMKNFFHIVYFFKFNHCALVLVWGEHFCVVFAVVVLHCFKWFVHFCLSISFIFVTKLSMEILQSVLYLAFLN